MTTVSDEELVRRGNALYEQQLKALLEPGHNGQFVAIEPDSGDHFLGRKMIDAIRAAQVARPGRQVFVARVGARTGVELY